MKSILLFAAFATSLSLAAISARAADAAANWTANCASCHGADGAGHTKAGRKLGAKDLTNASNQKAFTDDQGFTALKEGLKDANGKVQMQPVGDKLSDDEIKALMTYVRTLQK
jgi:mono/diheme cytochrome c family protein